MQPIKKKGFSGRQGETAFKVGDTPHNAKPVGAFSVRNDKRNNVKSLYYKPEGARKMVLYSKFVYEAVHGDVPKSFCIRHKDGDRLNCAIENLELISRADVMKNNTNRPKAAEKLRNNWQVRKRNSLTGQQAKKGNLI